MSRGLLLEDNTLEIVLAVGVIALLIGGFFYLGATFLGNQEQKNARKTLDSVVSTLHNLDQGQRANLTLQGFRGGDGWVIVGWNLNDPGRPDSCFLQDCLCVCKTDGDCQSAGACTPLSKPIDFSVRYTGKYFPHDVALSGSYYDGFVSRCLFLRQNLYELPIANSGAHFAVDYVLSPDTVGKDTDYPAYCFVSLGEFHESAGDFLPKG